MAAIVKGYDKHAPRWRLLISLPRLTSLPAAETPLR
jgi:hypothetical protein